MKINTDICERANCVQARKFRDILTCRHTCTFPSCWNDGKHKKMCDILHPASEQELPDKCGFKLEMIVC